MHNARKEAVEAVFAIRGLRITVLSVTIAAASPMTMEALLRAAHTWRDEDDFLNRAGAPPGRPDAAQSAAATSLRTQPSPLVNR